MPLLRHRIVRAAGQVVTSGAELAGAWRARGRVEPLAGSPTWVLDGPCRGVPDGPPVVLVHGFPTCAWDWRHLVDELRDRRRVLALDLPGYGSSAKPDRPYPLEEQAQVVVDLVASREIEEVDLVTHDMGDSVGGALLARDLEAGADGGGLPFSVRRRVLANGSIYLGMAVLTPGQRLAERLPPRRLPRAAGPLMRTLYRAGIRRVSGDTPIARADLDALWALTAQDDGHLLLPRLIRYLDDRRAHEERWTGAIERHPSPLHVVWGDADPVALVGMADRLRQARPDATVTRLPGVGHFPMLEAPAAFVAATREGLERPTSRGSSHDA